MSDADPDCDDDAPGDDPDLDLTDPLGERLFGRRPRPNRACAACQGDPARAGGGAEPWQMWRHPLTKQLLPVCWRCAHAVNDAGVTYRDDFFRRNEIVNPTCVRHGVERQ